MRSTDTAPEMADLKKMSKAELLNLAAQQRIQIALLQAVRDELRQQLEASEAENDQWQKKLATTWAELEGLRGRVS
jgi:hypothetical protein